MISMLRLLNDQSLAIVCTGFDTDDIVTGTR